MTAPDEKVQELLLSISTLRSKLLKLESALATYKLGEARSVEECIALVSSDEGRLNLEQVLKKTPFPHYEAIQNEPGILMRTEANGVCTRGRFVGRNFRVLATT